jgi:endo-1,4-beta-xylanase
VHHRRMGTDRRTFLRTTAMTAAFAGVSGTVMAQAGSQNPNKTGIPGPTTVPPSLPTLREAAEQKGFLVGTAVAAQPLRNDPANAQLVRQQANIVVAENAMKFGPIHPEPDKFFFADADALFAFAAENGIKVRGHNFVWHRQLPRWFQGYATKANAAQILTSHIETVGSRYAGRVHSWDVVNEAIEVKDNLPGGLRNSPWYQLLGPDYLDLAFHTARKVDPKALLCYNDYGIESESPGDAAKRAALLTLVRGMKDRGTPIDAVGIQSHISAGPKHVYAQGLQSFMRELQDLGLKLLLTEMDVNDRDLPADTGLRDTTVGGLYGGYLNLTLANPNVVALLTWGITDKYTWLNGEDSRPDKLPERALPFDANLRPKDAYVAEVEAIQALHTRS